MLELISGFSENSSISVFLPSEWTERHRPGRLSPLLQGFSGKTGRLDRTLSEPPPRRLWWRRTLNCPRRGWVLQYPAETKDHGEHHFLCGSVSTQWKNNKRDRSQGTLRIHLWLHFKNASFNEPFLVFLIWTCCSLHEQNQKPTIHL